MAAPLAMLACQWGRTGEAWRDCQIPRPQGSWARQDPAQAKSCSCSRTRQTTRCSAATQVQPNPCLPAEVVVLCLHQIPRSQGSWARQGPAQERSCSCSRTLLTTHCSAATQVRGVKQLNQPTRIGCAATALVPASSGLSTCACPACTAQVTDPAGLCTDLLHTGHSMQEHVGSSSDPSTQQPSVTDASFWCAQTCARASACRSTSSSLRLARAAPIQSHSCHAASR